MDDFDGFVRQNWDRLHAAVSRSARRYRQEPDDVLQEALLRAYANRTAFESDQHAINWICRVAHDLLCDQRRSWYGRRVTATADLPEAACGAAPDPADVVVRKDSGNAVLRALLALPPTHRLLLWQHAVDGRSYADIARDTSRPLATVRSVALRARTTARAHLAADTQFGLGAALAMRLRLWWGRGLTPTAPTAAAALLAIGLVAGGPGAPVPGGAPVQLPDARSEVTRTLAGSQPAPAAPAALPSDPLRWVAAAGVASPAPVPPPDSEAPAVTAVAFEGDGWGHCVTDGPATTPVAYPLVTLSGTYDCDVQGKSKTCTAVPEPVACSVTLRGNMVGDANGVPDVVYKCDTGNDIRAGEVVLSIAGRAPHVLPVELWLSNQGELQIKSPPGAAPGPFTVEARMPFVCAPGAMPRVTLQGTITAN